MVTHCEPWLLRVTCTLGSLAAMAMALMVTEVVLILLLYGQQVALLELGIYPRVQFSEQLFSELRNLYHLCKSETAALQNCTDKQSWLFIRLLTAGHWSRWKKVLCDGRE